MTNQSGRQVDIHLLRPQSWLDAKRARLGQSIWLELPELGAIGNAQVVSVDPCPDIQPGPGRVVTGTFTHQSHARILDVHLEGTDQPITCTANHAFWSETVQHFVPAGTLQAGDQVRTATGSTLPITKVSDHPGAHRVHNLEVHLEHVYQVSTQGVLVHNQSAPEPPTPSTQRSGLFNRFPEWKVGDSITKVTPEGNYPSWATIRSRYWQNRAAADAASFGPSNRAIMEKGFAPKARATVRDRKTGQIKEILVEKELHHARGERGVPGFDEPMDLREVWPWEHENLLPPGRRLAYDFVRFK
jgi:hypothetical protein